MLYAKVKPEQVRGKGGIRAVACDTLRITGMDATVTVGRRTVSFDGTDSVFGE